MKRILFLLGAFLSLQAGAQLTDLGKPFSYNGKFASIHNLPEITMQGFDLDVALFEDSLNLINPTGPYRFGYEYAVNIDMLVQGMWETSPSGNKICRLVVTCPNAHSVNVQFHDFYLPEGTRLDMYSEDLGYHHGAYTSSNNNPARMLGSDLVPGEKMIIEYQQPASVTESASLSLGMIVHGYRDIFSFGEYGGARVNESGNCNMDVVCPDGAPWALHKQAVARILVGGGLCTGSLVNNTANDGTPYFLTANHCGPQNMGSAVFRFNYESPVCGTGGNSVDPGSPYDQINGSVLRARRTNSDFGLIELNSVPPTSYQVYYAGWDNSGNPVPNCTGIHHPSGDVKKISFDDDPLTTTTYSSNTVNPNGTHWRIETWERNTTTEGGSSGSAIFDQNGRVIGQLHGGGAACGNTLSDWYGAFHVSWDGSGASERLRDWLDPANNTTTLDGYNPNAPSTTDDAGITAVNAPTGQICGNSFTPEVSLRNYGSNTLTSVNIVYDIDGTGAQTFNWTGSLGTGLSTTVTLPSMTSTNGNHTFNVTTDLPNGNPDGNTANNNASSSFNLYINGQIISFTLDPDCWGSELTWEVNDGPTTLYSGNGGSDATPNGSATITENWCLDVGCYDFVISDTYGDGMFGSQYGSCNVDGTYSIEDGTGNVLASIQAPDSDFGNQEINNFCVLAQTLGANFTQNNTSVCQGSTVNFTDVSTGNPVSWSWTFAGGSPAASSAQNPTVTYNTPGTYNVTLTVTDASAGTDTYTLTGAVTVNPNPSISASANNASCNGVCDGDAAATVTGGTAPYSISWSNGGSGTSINGLCPNTYSASVSDANGCSASAGSVLVTEPAALVANNSAVDATCGANDGSAVVTVTGGTSGYTYALNGGTPQANGNFNGLAVGSYTVDVTDANGCTTSTSFSIANPNAPVANTTSANISCNGLCDGTANAAVNGGTAPYSYSWTGGGSTASLSGLCAGTYQVTVTDAASCATSSTVTIIEPAVLSGNAVPNDEMMGNDGSINLSVTGGSTPYSYNWTGPNGFTSNTEDPSGLPAGTYNVTVTDANGCTQSFQATVGSQLSVQSMEAQRDITIYPNPNQGEFFVHIGKHFESNVQISIYTADGRLVHQQSNLNQETVRVQLALAKGLYLAEVADNKGRVIQKMVIK